MYFLVTILLLAVPFGAGWYFFVVWAPKRALENLQKYMIGVKASYDHALSELQKDSNNPKLRAAAVEKGHLYYKGIGGEAILRNQKKQLGPDEIPKLQYQTEHHARENLVQADIETILQKGRKIS